MKFHFTHINTQILRKNWSFSQFRRIISASEPNLLKIRIKQVIDRKARAGPLAVAARRQERILLANQRRLQKQVAIAQVASSM